MTELDSTKTKMLPKKYYNFRSIFVSINPVWLDLVNLPDQFWNTLWTDLIRIDEELARLNISPKDIKIMSESSYNDTRKKYGHLTESYKMTPEYAIGQVK